MPIEVAEHAGFCMGVAQAVKRAVQAAREASLHGMHCFSLGQLIHNPLEVQRLTREGIIPTENLEEAQGAVLIIRSHGVSRAVLQQAQTIAGRVVDCTCPFVARLHELADQFSQDGAPVVLVGDAKHPEMIGTAGWCHGAVHFVDSTEHVAHLPPDLDKALVLCQTTFPPHLWQDIQSALQEKYPGITVRNTICGATRMRQSEAQELAQRSDMMVVVGGKDSANTRKLYETCKNFCEKTILVESAVDLPPDFGIIGKERIGVTAGASTPAWILREVIDSMNDMEQRNNIHPDNEQVTPDTQAEVAPQAEEAAVETAEQPEVAPQADEAAVEAVEQPEVAPQADEAAVETVEQPEVAPQADEAAVEAVEQAAPATEQPAPATEQPAPEAAQEPAAPAAEESAPQAEEEPAQPKAEASFMDQVAASMARIRNGQTVTGKVVQITEDEVCVNIGYKSDGLIQRSELVDQDVQLGDEIDVEVVKVNDGEGNVILSQRNIVNRKLWEELMAKYEAGEFVDAVGKEAVKGGLLASINGVRAFVPASHLAQRYVEKISQFVGQDMKLKIIEVDTAKKRVVASRKEVLIAENAARKEAVWGSLQEGAIVRGIVRRFASFGAFVDLGGVDGLIHVSDLSWNRSAVPSEILQANQEIDVKILGLDRERERIQLGYKQLQPKPWDNVEEKYPVGSIITRQVVRIRPFGAFIELEPGVDGLVHISQVAPHRINKVEDVLSPGQEVNVKILSVDPDARRISLSIREALEENAFDYSADIPGGGEYYQDQEYATVAYEDTPAETEEAPVEADAETTQEEAEE
ncbi:MAG: bifunctional 4-hydroxy-3-methylbut-2-enyl diphosphate reductase/30S ribosomal protein S1 [Christensenellales bacterium]|jgi:(E)-4-hydroxy-3-methyl-but-2-enyl pyrophosphate reductase